MKKKLIVWFSEVDKDDINLVGGKGANLGEMVKSGFPVPNGFIVTSYAYFEFIKQNNLEIKIKHLLGSVNFDRPESLMQASSHIKRYIMQGNISDKLLQGIFTAYKRLGGIFNHPLVAVRSSATAEDLPGASFAGQQETFLNVEGEASLVLRIKEAWASLFNARAIFYRHEKHFDHFKVGIAIPVQKMVNSEKSGIMFTIDPVTNDKKKIVIEAIYGLGEYIVQGKVTPDHYEVSKDNFEILLKNIEKQEILYRKSGRTNKELKVPNNISKKQKISDNQIKKIAELGLKLEKHYYFPQDVEWALEKGKVHLVQTRPVTTINLKSQISNLKSNEGENGKLLLTGSPASPGIVTGMVRIIHSPKEIDKILKGEILVATQTNPDYVPAMKKAAAIVTDAGGRTSHAAIVSRELGIPAIVGTQNATKVLKTGLMVTVNGIKGEVYKGSHLQPSTLSDKAGQFLTLEEERIRTKTKVYVNLGEPEAAERVSKMNIDGVGLLRAEFMMAGIGIHPKKLIKEGKKDFFVKKLSDGLEAFCKAFYPRPVVYRTSDFKTNEYRNLIGGKEFEPIEPNPMLGFRGAYRYICDPKVFNLELEAIKKVREKLGYKNLWVMLPFVRTVDELIRVKKIINNSGLKRSDHFKLWMMVEIPSNVILLEKFLEVGIDGVSIGSNDLTMLILGTDRDNSEVASEFNEKNDAVIWALEHIITTTKKYNVTSSICGQAPSEYPTLVEKLVSLGITSVSVTPDAIGRTKKIVYEAEQKIFSKK